MRIPRPGRVGVAAAVGLLTTALVVPPGAQAAPGPVPATVATTDDPVPAPPTDATGDAIPVTPPAAEPVEPSTEEAGFVPDELVEDAGTTARTTAAARKAAADGEPLVATAAVVGFGVVGVTWTGDVDPAALVVEVRTSTDPAADPAVDAGWSAWEETQAEPSPDGTLDGTEPVLVGDVAQVQARVTGDAAGVVRDLALAVVDPGTSAADDDVAAPPTEVSPSGAAVVAAAVPTAPTIATRAAWGADESMMTWSPRQGSIRGATIHHTAGTNSYSSAQVPGIIRGIYAYHANTRDWGDIGYNFLVDKFGRVWEGRAGGILSQTIGGHAIGFNTNTTGVSVLGNYDLVQPSAASVSAVVRLTAWKLALHDVPATGTTTIEGKRLPRILGHRDVAATACPGRYLYPKLGEIRRRAQAAQDAAPRPVVKDGTLVRSPSGDVALVEAGRRHATWCSTAAHYGLRCGGAATVTATQWNALKPGGRLRQTVRTTDGRLFRVVDGVKREAFDTASLKRAGLLTTTVTMSATALERLPYRDPVVRPGVVVTNRDNGNTRLVTSGLRHGYIGDAIRQNTPLRGLPFGYLDGASMARMTKTTKTTGVVTRPGKTFVVTTKGLLRVDRSGALRARTQKQAWATGVTSKISKVSRPSLVVLRVRTKDQLYVLRDGVLRPVTAKRARQLNGGTAPRVHVVVKLTKQQFPVGKRL
ncbi:N-acetylmuramoyl-L-alanine amidase [Isoptericola dokdonensis]|uniref:N-acetylmuramoyl-L-alanine amidase n=1 Tax=Isoptericola dokdonensis DS-3 TaxID=1300344 RepID=A0A168G030_9MICO|nr:N-acetylmuramoyl-L-alanine amidase [Isoptericola dokdonensis]ANC32821.1 N-acetylmuramoyl-L-alanine amidase [Isoptericola dokdonensis DS-3]